MRSYRFVIHVGYPKAASTALQGTLAGSRERLKSVGVFYPESLLGQGVDKHEELFRLVRLNKVKKALKQLELELNAVSNIHTVVLSTESIINQIDNVDYACWEELFRGLKRMGRLEVLVIHRDSESFLNSYYKQAVINQPSALVDFYSSVLPLSKFAEIPAIAKLLDIQSVVDKLGRVSGAPVKVFDFSDQVVGEVVRWLVGDDFLIDPPQRSNQSMKAEEVELIRQLNATEPTPEQRNAWFRVLGYCSGLSSRTAQALANRASDEDLLYLDADWLLTVELEQNPKLNVDRERLWTVSQKAHSWLCHYQSLNEVLPSSDKED